MSLPDDTEDAATATLLEALAAFLNATTGLAVAAVTGAVVGAEVTIPGNPQAGGVTLVIGDLATHGARGLVEQAVDYIRRIDR